MQFVQDGPDVPDTLLQAHEENNVIFFCGAGISYPAGLRGFSELVRDIYKALSTTPTQVEQKSITSHQYDATLDLLERRYPGQRAAVRKVLPQVLKPNLRLKHATATHKALLQLARTDDGATRLVTTNFDRIFQGLMDRTKPPITAYAAPFLPIPKKSRWNGVVYLHGLLPKVPDGAALDRLVLTSGDFGLAYLTERWASQFVTELFRNYTVCFVGYSINDPVLRYMMDALAADRMLGEFTPQAYAFVDYAPGQQQQKYLEWDLKDVIPILYEVPDNQDEHSALHRTLRAWAETYRDGVQGKERIVVSYAMTKPSNSTRQDDFVGRMLWALTHETGLPAKRFAEFNPVPSLDWLEALSDNRFKHDDLSRFGVVPNIKKDDKLSFSLARRPTPYHLAPQMCLVSFGPQRCDLDPVMLHLAHWLRRHLNDPALILWLAQHGATLNERFSVMIERELSKLIALERDGNVAELDSLRANAPNCVPTKSMRLLWRLLLTGRAKAQRHGYDIFLWIDQFGREEFSTLSRLQLRELLTPIVILKKAIRWQSETTDYDTDDVKNIVDWELALKCEHAYSSLENLRRLRAWQTILPVLLPDVHQLLRDALDLQRDLGAADDRNDRSYWDMPSISHHAQNRGFRDWVVLIELVRDAWIAIYHQDPASARRLARTWMLEPYPTFKRLALFAASQPSAVTSGEWVDWVSGNNRWWLWSVETQREVMRLLVLQGDSLPPSVRHQLEREILSGPPRDMFRSDLSEDEWIALESRMIWLRLAKLASQGSELGDGARAKLTELSSAHPRWRLALNERDEFSHWMSGTGDPDYEDMIVRDKAPRETNALAVWLEGEPDGTPFHEDDWREICRTQFALAFTALSKAAKKDLWPIKRWDVALNAWSEKEQIKRSWFWAGPCLQKMPTPVFADLVHSASWWLNSAAKILNRNPDIFLDLCRRIAELEYPNPADTNDPVGVAINHPVGHAAQALLDYWFRSELNDNQGIPGDIRPLITSFCDVQVPIYRHARVILASRLIALFRIDRRWTEKYLLPLFNWQTSESEARAAWEGFLWSPRLFRPLLASFKTDFLRTAQHYEQLGEHAQQYARFLTFAALEPEDTFNVEELRHTIGSLPQEGLVESLVALVQSLESAGEQTEENWKNRVLPFWREIWPKALDLISEPAAAQLARLAIAARGEFPAALNEVIAWLQPLDHSYFIIHKLQEAGLSSRFPRESLALLDRAVGHQPWASKELIACLQGIVGAWPDAAEQASFRRLREFTQLG